MKILISKDALKRHSLSIPAHAGFSQTTMDWRKTLGQYVGQWVTVETEFLFEDQFNVVEGNLRIDATLCDDIDFEEIGTFEDYKNKVKERYSKDWPGSKLNFYQIKAALSRAGKMEHPARTIEKTRGYDMNGKALK